jgi:hypothetical protein
MMVTSPRRGRALELCKSMHTSDGGYKFEGLAEVVGPAAGCLAGARVGLIRGSPKFPRSSAITSLTYNQSMMYTSYYTLYCKLVNGNNEKRRN